CGVLETRREYGWEQLADSGELAAARSRHRDWYLQLAEQADTAHLGQEHKQWLTRLEAELDNLRAALGWCQEEADAAPAPPGTHEVGGGYPAPGGGAGAGLRLVVALGWLWGGRGHLAEGMHWLEGMLARSSELPAKARAPALRWAGRLASGLGDWQRTR